MDGLFAEDREPLASQLRPDSLEDIFGQRRALAPHGPIEKLITSPRSIAAILTGPPGIGKTTLAHLIGKMRAAHFVAISGAGGSVRDIKEITSQASLRLRHGDGETLCFVDEIHRFSKTQQDALLGPIESGTISFLGATTENPATTLASALLSRVSILTLDPLDASDIARIILRACERNGFQIEEEPLNLLAIGAQGDARRALRGLEIAMNEAVRGDSPTTITISEVPSEAQIVGIDTATHYELTSALIKSLRASNEASALDYLARLLTAGEDPRFIARRLAIFASEDIGLANTQALAVTNAALAIVSQIGMPEARITLAHATLYLAGSQKSRTVIDKIDAAIASAAGRAREKVPEHLRGSITGIEQRRTHKI